MIGSYYDNLEDFTRHIMETESSSSSTSSMKKSVIMAMNSPSTTTSSQTWCQLMWPRTFLFFFLLIIFSISSVSSSRTPIPYADHCDSIVPESTPTVPGDFTTFPFRRTVTSHYTGGNRILGKKSSQFSFDYEKYLSFRIIKSIYKTKASGVYKIEAYLIFRSSNSYYLPRNSTYGPSYYHHPRDSRLKFLLNGFWSESTGKLCMVGSASWYSREGNSLNLDAILKLNCAKNSTIFTSLVSGSLESLSSSNAPNYFEPVSILAFPSMNGYNYTLVSDGFDNGCPGGIEIPQNQSLSLQPRSICSMLSGRFNNFELEYASKCDSLQNCTPFGGGIGYLPHVMSLKTIQCSEEEQKLRYFVQFSNSSYAWYYQNFNLNATLVGEGSWDSKKNRLCITACRILNVTDSLGNVNVGNCSIRLSLRFPAVWSIRNKSAIVGQIWTNKMVNDSGYFDRITFRSSENEMVGVPGLKYEYTEIERVRKSCPMKNPVKNKGVRYPSGFSYEMRFDMSLKDSKGKYSWGNAVPIFVGDQFYERYRLISPMQEDSIGVVEEGSDIVESSVIETNTNYSGPLNISYKISFTPLAGDKLGDGIFPYNFSLSPNGQVEISAEGIYNADTGHLCMVGCKKVGSDIQKSTNDSVDCDILVNFQFPPLNSMKGSVIKGSIQSTRENTDPLYFKPLNMSSNAYYTAEAKQSIWRMDLEIVMVLTSNTLACVFVGLQLFYVKKHPDVLPFISLVMLVILTLGHMIPLVLNFEAMFLQNRNRQNVLLGSGGWLEVNEVIVRVVTMVAFLLQFRLLQLAWAARLGDGNQKVGLWVAEMKALFVSLPLYIVGGLIAFFVNSTKNKYSTTMLSSIDAVYQQQTLWGDLRSYAGLVLDGFLFPQILFNVFQISKESSLSRSFYIGTTFVRLLPHAYDLYRAHNYVQRHFDGSYFYANPTADFYSTVWDIIIPLGGMLFAVIIYLQQKFGGRCILPGKFRESRAYEKVPVVSSE